MDEIYWNVNFIMLPWILQVSIVCLITDCTNFFLECIMIMYLHRLGFWSLILSKIFPLRSPWHKIFPFCAKETLTKYLFLHKDNVPLKSSKVYMATCNPIQINL